MLNPSFLPVMDDFPGLSLESFVDHFGFEKPELTASQGMVPLACAVLSEDLERLGAKIMVIMVDNFW
jgi:hypothetical protein